MRPEESEPVCIVNGCGRSTLHRVGECAPVDAPSYSDGAEVQALVDDALTEPFLIESMRKKPTGDIKHTPGVGRGALGTSAAGFLRELDDYIAVRTSAAVKQVEQQRDDHAADAIRTRLALDAAEQGIDNWRETARRTRQWATAELEKADAAVKQAQAEGFGKALRAVLDRADEGNEFGPKNYSLLVRIVRDVDLDLARGADL